ncbi:unnamed protein product [Callosobruchus maculatus]|uniref:Uncharacterized protein n=1 Tax=Callosobruchus maculatus TaxID=64391 RepID=A0A653CKB8_CALMS|nr:unnamed protein product [Callosobruchus maculatus]
MALKNTKISREISRQFNRYISIKSDASLKPEVQNIIQNDSHVRYTLTSTEKPDLPHIDFAKDVDEVPLHTKHLQPSMLPNFIAGTQEREHAIDKWTDSFIKRQVEHKEPGVLRITVKANKFGYCRNFHTATNVSPFKTISRLYASSHNKCKKEECPPKPKKCKKNLACPSFTLDNCPPAQTRIGCKREYVDPDCKKVDAPYKSYSELCAQRLPDDPSECMQCPWQRCGGVDDIKPPKRKYHTATLAQTMNSSQSAPGFFYDCDAKKKPCRPPPPKCKKDPCQKEECPEVKRRCPTPCGIENTSFNKKKCSDWTAAFRLWSDKENILADKDWLDMQVMPVIKKIKEQKEPEGTAINYEMKKCPKREDKCPKKERRRIEIDRSIDERFKPIDPCCKKQKQITRRSPANRNPKVYVPDPPNYDNTGKL